MTALLAPRATRTRNRTQMAPGIPGGTKQARTVRTPHKVTNKVSTRRGPKLLDEDTAGDLEGRIADKKRAEYPSQMGVIDAEFLADFRPCDGDVGTVKEGNRAEDEQPEDEKITDGQSPA